MQLTEPVNPRTPEIDLVPTLEMVRLMADEDARVAAAVALETEPLARDIGSVLQSSREVMLRQGAINLRYQPIGRSGFSPNFAIGLNRQLVQRRRK